MGCTNGVECPRPLGEDSRCRIADIDVSSLFFLDSAPISHGDIQACLYTRVDERALGEAAEEDIVPPDLSLNHCFNCGSPEHIVSSCNLPHDHQLIALSRQLYNFLKTLRGDNRIGEPQRIHVVEEWKRQRFEWLDTFKPGEVTSFLLKDALGLDGEDPPWLKNMAIWGYPKGWESVTDPRVKVRETILRECADFDDCSDNGDLTIVGEDGTEIVNFDPNEGNPSESTWSIHSEHASISHSHSKSQRWACYPPVRFSSERLPTYSGYALPPITYSNRPSSHSMMYFDSLGAPASGPSESAVVPYSIFDLAPPPPPVSPPPLPPDKPIVDMEELGEFEGDMDMSDSE
jgi:zinc finger CCHC domain-containing protein 8